MHIQELKRLSRAQIAWGRRFHARGVPARRGRHGVPVAAPPKPGKKTVSAGRPVPGNSGGHRKRGAPRANRVGGAFPRARRADQTWAAWGPSGGTAETGKKNGIGGPPGASKLRGPPEAAAPRANRVGGAFPRARRAGQTWAAWGPSGGTAETGKKNGIGGPTGASKLRGPPEAAAPRANRVGGAFPRTRRAGQTWAAWGPSGGTAETGKKNGIGGPPGASKLRGQSEAAAPRANRVGGAFPRARRAGQTWAAWGPGGGKAETGKKNGIGGPPGTRKLRGPPEAAAPRANRVGGTFPRETASDIGTVSSPCTGAPLSASSPIHVCLCVCCCCVCAVFLCVRVSMCVCLA
jgi:hypothetical protein